MEKRSQGRPCRGTSEVGRQKIIDGIRHYMRSDQYSDFSRKTVARAVGVTPALITYYFPKKDDLVEQVTAPILHHYANELEKCATSDESSEVRLRHIISLLANLYGKEGRILDAYKAFIQNRAQKDENEIERMSNTLGDFFFQWRGYETAKSFDAAVLQGTVRAMCEFANSVRTDAAMEPAGRPFSISTWLEPLHRMFACGSALFPQRSAVPEPLLAS